MKTTDLLIILLIVSSFYGCNTNPQTTDKAENLNSKDTNTQPPDKSEQALKETSKSILDLSPRGDKLLLSRSLRMEVIGKNEFDIQKPGAVNYLVYDTTAVRKTERVLKILCNSDTLKYLNNPGIPYDENLHEYEFVGEIPFLNVFVVSEKYYESMEPYIFIDKSTCKEVKVCDDYPHISFDRKHIINIGDDFIEEENDPGTSLAVYAIQGKKVKRLFVANFENWRPASYEDMFWGKDGNFYLKAVPPMFPDGKITYLKVRLL